MGFTSVTLARGKMLPGRAVFLILTGVSSVAGCSSAGAITGAVVGASTGAATVNPIVGYVAAVGVNAGVDELQKYISRVRQGAEQDAIVSAVGEMQPGENHPGRSYTTSRCSTTSMGICR